MNTPSIKTLSTIFGDNAKLAKSILTMSRAELLELPACIARDNECYNAPCTYDLRMTALNELGEFYGVEVFWTAKGYPCEYLNAGDTYTPTLARFRGRYSVTTWGDIAERHMV